MIIVIKPGRKAYVAEWREAFAELAPHIDVRELDDPTVNPAEVRYALVWDPPHGRLAQFTNLELLISMGAGVDCIVTDPAWPRHLPLVRMVPPEGPQRMSEYVAWAVLSMQKDLPRIIRAQNSRVWDTFYPQNPARLCTVGIMGLGVMGQSSAEMLRNMGLPVIGWSRSPKTLPGIETFHGQEGLGAFLARTQILVSQLPATPETKNIFSAPLLSQLPRGAALVNAGRGSQQNLPDIIAALDSGHLAGAVLDVFDTEPLPADSAIWSHPKIVVTCHIASSPTKLECTRYTLDLIAAFERGDALPNLYDPTRGY